MPADFTVNARGIWESLPLSRRMLILNSVWCSRCKRATTIRDYRGNDRRGRLFLQGSCQRCGSAVEHQVEQD